jgi:hypothetical protein
LQNPNISSVSKSPIADCVFATVKPCGSITRDAASAKNNIGPCAEPISFPVPAPYRGSSVATCRAQLSLVTPQAVKAQTPSKVVTNTNFPHFVCSEASRPPQPDSIMIQPLNRDSSYQKSLGKTTNPRVKEVSFSFVNSNVPRSTKGNLAAESIIGTHP